MTGTFANASDGTAAAQDTDTFTFANNVPANSFVTVEFSHTVGANEYNFGDTASNTVSVTGGDSDTDNSVTVESCSVTYDANGGSGDVPQDNASYVPGDTVTVQSSPAPTPPSGYQFIGWSLDRSGGVINDFTINDSNVTLFAQYTLAPIPVAYYHVTYNANGGSGAVPTDGNSYTAGQTVNVQSSPAPTRAGYRFIGWAFSPNDGGTVSNFAIYSDVVLYADWFSTTTVISGTSTPTVIVTPPANTIVTPTQTIPNTNVPLVAAEDTATWSILSMLMSIVALLGALLLIITGFVRKRNDSDNSEWQRNMQNGYVNDGDEYEREDSRKRRSVVFRVAATIVGIITPVIWLILDNIFTTPVFINRWTIVVAVAFIVFAVLWILFMVSRKRKNDSDDGMSDAGQAPYGVPMQGGTM
jgi:hypothetical protein